MAHDQTRDDGIQHGIDDNPNDDSKKGATLGGLGGAAVGAAAGSVAGPVGTLIGAAIGAAAGALASGAAVAAVDQMDNDDTVSGLGDGATTDIDDRLDTDADMVPGNRIPGIQTGGRDIDGTPDARGIMEKTSDALTGDRIDDKTGKPVAGSLTSSAAMSTGSLGATGSARRLDTDFDTTARAGEVRVPVTEESADVRKIEREVGQVSVNKVADVETHHIAEPVERTRVIVEERDLGTGAAPAAAARSVQEGQVLSVPVTEEELVVQKVPHTREMIIRTETDTKMVEQDVTLRKERAEIEEDGDVEVEGPRAVGSSPRV